MEFNDINDAARALTSLNGVELKGRSIYVREDREAGNSSSATDNVSSAPPPRNGIIYLECPRLYVNNLSWDVAWQDLKDLFRQVCVVLW